MKRFMLCLILLLLLSFPIVGKTTIQENNAIPQVKSSSMCNTVSNIQLSENGTNENDPATDDGEDLMDGDSDSNSNDDSDRDNG